MCLPSCRPGAHKSSSFAYSGECAAHTSYRFPPELLGLNSIWTIQNDESGSLDVGEVTVNPQLSYMKRITQPSSFVKIVLVNHMPFMPFVMPWLMPAVVRSKITRTIVRDIQELGWRLRSER